MKAKTAAAMARPTGTLMRNSQCHDIAWVSQPPKVGPMVGASVAVRPISTETPVRRLGGKSRKVVANTVGIIAPPRKPCSAR